MVIIDMNNFYKTITESVPNYIMFITLIVLGYSMCVAFVKILCENIIKVILAVRAPIVSCVGKEPEKN